MMARVAFSVPGKPRGKQRPRVVNGHTYTPEETRSYEALIRLCYITAKGGFFERDHPLSIDIAAFILQAPSNKDRNHVAMRKPDIDNIIKIVLDALNGVAYRDDVQVVRVTASKVYVQKGPHVNVQIEDV